jgi:hypothetical protein
VQIARITLPDLGTTYKDFAEQLALRWSNANLSSEWHWEGEPLPEPVSYLYIDYLHTIGTLLLTTQDVERTRQLIIGVLNQAEELGRSSLWVEQELKFEGMIHGADRADFLRLDLEQTASVNNILDDATLDRYNERISRFDDHDQ